jgi:hypothetical protein
MRRAVAAAATLVAALLAACTASGPGARTSPAAPTVSATAIISGPAPSARPSTSARPAPLSEPDPLHPGAAVLAGDAAEPKPAPIVPSLATATKDYPAYVDRDCETPQSSSTQRFCTFGDTSDPKLTVALVGDSVAGEWLPPLQRIAASRHWKVITDLRSRCPFSATMTVNSRHTDPYVSCHEWGANALHSLLTLKPDVVITSDRPVLGIPGHPTADAHTLAAIGDGMATYWRTLLAHHIPVVAIRESPEMGIDEPVCLQQSKGALGPCSVRAADAITPDPPTVVAARQVAAARLIDMNRFICTDTCIPVVGNVLVFRDRHHITATYSATTAPYLLRALLAVPTLRG